MFTHDDIHDELDQASIALHRTYERGEEENLSAARKAMFLVAAKIMMSQDSELMQRLKENADLLVGASRRLATPAEANIWSGIARVAEEAIPVVPLMYTYRGKAPTPEFNITGQV